MRSAERFALLAGLLAACEGGEASSSAGPPLDATAGADRGADAAIPPADRGASPDAPAGDLADATPPRDGAAPPDAHAADFHTADASPDAPRPDAAPTDAALPDAAGPDGGPLPLDALPPPPRPDRGVLPACTDDDGDGYLAGGCTADEDCDDHNADVYPHAPEICDGLDNDCDFAIDEDINFQSHPLHCGFCGNVCSEIDPTYQCRDGVCRAPAAVCPGGCERPHALTECVEPGVCAVIGCQETWWDANHSADDGCEYQCLVTRDGTEFCDQIDNDCDGEIDELCVGP